MKAVRDSVNFLETNRLALPEQDAIVGKLHASPDGASRVAGTTTMQEPVSIEAIEATEEKRAALTYLSEAFAEAQLDGLDGDCMAHAALFAAFRELIATYGEDAVASFAERLPEKIRSGGFTTGPRH
jgi:hypothetical protein